VAYIGFLDAQKEVDKAKKAGAQGYCMGGALVVRTAGALPGRIGAGASFHGGGLAPTSPTAHTCSRPNQSPDVFRHRGQAMTRASRCQGQAQGGLRGGEGPTEIEVYTESVHGWCVPDMPIQNGKPTYNKADAERAWTKLMALYKAGLA